MRVVAKILENCRRCDYYIENLWGTTAIKYKYVLKLKIFKSKFCFWPKLKQVLSDNNMFEKKSI